MKSLKLKMLTAAITLTAISASAQEEKPEQKKWNFGFHLGSDQYFASKPKPNPHNYKLENTYSYKAGIFAERNLNEKESILIGLNYNFYRLRSFDQYKDYYPLHSASINWFADLDLQYKRNIGNNFRYFAGINIAFQRGHSNYAGGELGREDIFRTEGKATDFNLGLNTGIKYVLNPKSKFKIEPYAMIGINAFKKDKEESVFYPNIQQENSLSNFQTRFGVNFKF